MTTENVCAWCSKDQGRVDPPGTSHKICAVHLAAMMDELKTMKLKKTNERIHT